MKLSYFAFTLPEKNIAAYPAAIRDESRLMVYDKKTDKVEHFTFKDIIHQFSERDTLVFNDTKVFPARLVGEKEKTKARIEVFLLRELNQQMKLWDVLVDPARKIRIGNKLFFGENHELTAEVIDNTTSRGRTLRFLTTAEHKDFEEQLMSLGEIPIPTNILGRQVEPEDTERYQTIYAREKGAIAPPTAGLHFSRELFKRFEIIGINRAFLTLHIGLSNYNTIDVEALSKHRIAAENVHITANTANIINDTIHSGHRVCAVGATVVRAIESAVNTHRQVEEYKGWTNKFLYPPKEIKIPDMLLSGFQLPKTPYMMVSACFIGTEKLHELYSLAIKEGYRFGPYGDALLMKK